MTQTHSSLPWKVEICRWDDGDYARINSVDDSISDKIYTQEDAEFIVRACNAYYELAEALEELVSWQNGPPLITYEKGWNRAMELAENALKKAQGKESK